MSASEDYESQIWGQKEWPTEKDISRQFSKRPEHMFVDEDFEELYDFWRELTALGNPFEYATIGRKVYDEDDHAYFVGFYFPNERLEFYEIGEELDGKVNIAFLDEENHQHGFGTETKNYDELPNWIKEFVELEDDLHWREWNGDYV